MFFAVVVLSCGGCRFSVLIIHVTSSITNQLMTKIKNRVISAGNIFSDK
jgi:hypothetical protein